MTALTHSAVRLRPALAGLAGGAVRPLGRKDRHTPQVPDAVRRTSAVIFDKKNAHLFTGEYLQKALAHISV